MTPLPNYLIISGKQSDLFSRCQENYLGKTTSCYVEVKTKNYSRSQEIKGHNSLSQQNRGNNMLEYVAAGGFRTILRWWLNIQQLFCCLIRRLLESVECSRLILQSCIKLGGYFYTRLIAASREPNPEGSPCCFLLLFTLAHCTLLLRYESNHCEAPPRHFNLGTLTRHFNVLEKLLPQHEPDLKRCGRQIVADAVADLILSLDVTQLAATTFLELLRQPLCDYTLSVTHQILGYREAIRKMHLCSW